MNIELIILMNLKQVPLIIKKIIISINLYNGFMKVKELIVFFKSPIGVIM